MERNREERWEKIGGGRGKGGISGYPAKYLVKTMVL
jgi:hypothetical protein